MMPIPLDPTVNVTRSFAFKLGLPSFSSADFFMSAGTQCQASEVEETAERLYQLCYDRVSADVTAYRSGIQQVAEEVLHPERTQAPEVSPFRVTAAANPSNEVEKQEPSNVDELKTKAVTEKLTEKSTEAPRRGRPPKQPTPINEAQKSTPEPAKEEPKNGFVASDDDLPKAIGGTSEVPPGPDLKAKHEEIRAAEVSKQAAVNSLTSGDRSKAGPQPPSEPPAQWDRFVAVIDDMAKEGKRTRDNVEAAVKDFCRGFLNLEKLPKPPDSKYEPIIPILESLSRVNSALIMAEGKKAGLEAGVGWNKFDRHTEKWRPELREAATSVAILRYPDNCMDLLDFLHNIAKLGELDRNLYVFLLVFKQFNAAVAMGLKVASEETSRPMTEIVEGLDLSSCTEGELLSRFSGNAQSTKDSDGKLWDEA